MAKIIEVRDCFRCPLKHQCNIKDLRPMSMRIKPIPEDCPLEDEERYLAKIKDIDDQYVDDKDKNLNCLA